MMLILCLQTVLSILAVLLTCQAANDGLKCIQCDSRKEETPGECLESPPASTHCTTVPSDQEWYCVVTRHLDGSGKLLEFERSCSMRRMGNGCEGIRALHSTDEAKICYSTCATDGCNAGSGTEPRLGDLVVSRLPILCLLVIGLHNLLTLYDC